MNERAPYSRVYWSVMEDAKFDGIREDMRALGAWTLLLIVADMAWPSPAFIPTVARSSVAKLIANGLIDVLPGRRFRVHGLDAEREKRTDSARNAAAVRWQMRPHTNGNAESMPRRGIDEAETRRDETTREVSDGRADLEAFLLVTRRAPTPRQRQVLDGVLLVHDVTGPQWSADIIMSHPDDPIGAVIEADKAWRSERIAEAQAAERKPPQPRRKGSGLTGINAELAELLHKQYQEESA